MAKREKHKDIELSGRKFRINRFDALTGSYIVYQLFNNFLPMLGKGLGKEGINISLESKPEELIGLLSDSLPMMPKEQFTRLQKECLAVCHEITLVGDIEAPVAVLMADGRFGVEDIEDNVFAVISLMIHAIIFNVSGFFGESGLKGLGDSFKGLSR